MRSTSSLKRDTAFAVLALGVVAATSILGQIATYPNLAPWYAGLVKPSFNPPNWIFAPVWTTLYALMAFALWRILRVRMPSGMHRRYMVGLFFLLLALNAAWSWMFFWAHSPLLGLINIVPQLGLA
ncbi:MAG: TspO/MBR family protein [Pseudolabrys sp.]